VSKANTEQLPATPKAVDDAHALLAWMLPQLDKLPRARRFTLGSRIEDGLLFVLERLVEAAYSKRSSAAFKQSNRRLPAFWVSGQNIQSSVYSS